MPTDAPSNLPPVLRPDAPARPLARRPRRALRRSRSAARPPASTLTGLTLATADLRPGDVFVAVRGVNRHGAEFAAAAAEKGAVAIVTDAEGADRRRRRADCPWSSSRTPADMLGDLSAWVYGTGRDDHLPILFGTDRHERQDERLAPPRGHPRPARRRHGSLLDRGAPHRRPGRRLAAHDTRGVRDARAPRPHARARRRSRRCRSERAGAEPAPCRRHRVRRRRRSPTSLTITSTTTPTCASTSRRSCRCSCPIAPGAR